MLVHIGDVLRQPAGIEPALGFRPIFCSTQAALHYSLRAQGPDRYWGGAFLVPSAHTPT